MDALILPLGVTAVGLVVIRFLGLTWSSFRCFSNQKRHDQLSIELMQRRIEAVSVEREAKTLAWNGYRKFVIEGKTTEADGICSFRLAPHDGKHLPAYQSGQYLTFRLNIPGREKPVIRCYSLSERPNPDAYRITIKRVKSPTDAPSSPPGLISNYFHEQLDVGDILDAQAPRGHFVLDPEKERPAVLIAGGVGITPLLSMMNSVADSNSGREIMLFYGVRNRSEHAFRVHLEQLVEQHANLRMVVCYSQPTQEDEQYEGRDYQHSGRITVELLRSYLQSTNYDFYICSAPAMMESLSSQLKKWGVAKKDIATEAFGPAVAPRSAQGLRTAETGAAETGAAETGAAETGAAETGAATCQVAFAKTGKEYGWSDKSGNLLEFAESHGVKIDSGCRAGNCGTCVVAIKSGNVSYLSDHGADLEDGACLVCVAMPKGDLVLDA